jgi:hypothetical protein
MRGAVVCVAVAIGLLPAAAQANTPITSFTALPSTTQAGGHPDLEVQFTVNNRYEQHSKSACDCEDAKDAIVHLPTGFIGNPAVLPYCSIADFSADACPIDSQVGIVNIVTDGNSSPFNSPVYNLAPPPNKAGLLGFKILLFDTPQFEVVSARTGGDYGLDVGTTSIFHGSFPLNVFQQVIWGVPADPSHDVFREDATKSEIGPAYGGSFCDADGNPSTADPSSVVAPCGGAGASIPPGQLDNPSNSPLTPFLQNPTTCDAPLSSSLDVLSYDGGTDHAEYPWPQGTGCDQLSFNPSLFAQPTTTAADSPSGIDVDLEVPQPQSRDVPSPSELRAATVTLPPGFSINPNAADGKTSCTDAEANFGTTDAANCPDFSKVGSLTILIPSLPGPLPGFVYLGQPLPGNRYRIFLVADGFATHVKLAGTVTPDPVTGQLQIIFTNLPESPLTEFSMHFFGSERGALATPTQCGTYPVTSSFTPWDSALPTQTSTQFFTIDQGPNGTPCPGPQRPFNPSFQAASAGNTAGAHTPFSVDLTRNDGDQFLSGLSVTSPLGFSGTLKGIPYCPESAIAQLGNSLYSGLAELASPACPAASQIGTAIAGAGDGAHPLYLPGKVYLAGPYKGAPLSLVVVIPAVSGPYDLGNVAVRAAIEVNPVSAQVTTVSDPLPQILDGIPLRTRSIRVSLDRPDFALNPTSCNPLSSEATITGDQGAQANLSSPFQVANCASLPFAPKLALNLTGGVRRRGHPAIHAVLQTKPSEANPSSVSVTLPPGELLDNAHIGTVCTKPEFAANDCPGRSLVGNAEVATPLLDKPLTGPVYLRSSNRGLPDLAIDLQGQIHITVIGQVDAVHARLRTTFPTIPDAPVGRFTVNFLGGSKGLVQNSETLCGAHKKAAVQMTGQNGKNFGQSSELQVACGSGPESRKGHRAHHSRRAHRCAKTKPGKDLCNARKAG